MKYALIGCGRISKNHITAAEKSGMEIIALCDINEQHIAKVKAEHNLVNSSISEYTDYVQMITNEKLDVVAIATESGLHAEIAIHCIKNHVNVVIEKPMAMSIKDARTIEKLAKEYNVKVAVCHQNRYNVAIQKLKEAVDNDRFGKLSHGSINVRWNRDENYYTQAPWRGTWEHDGGCLMNQCIHGIDLLRWLFGSEVDEIYGATRQQQHNYLEAEDVGVAIVKFKNGAITTIEGTTNTYPKNLEETLYMFGETGTVKIGGTSTNNIDVWEFAHQVDGDGENAGLKEQTSNVYGNGHMMLYVDIVDAINNDKQPYINATEGKNALEVVLAIYKSQKTGQAIKLPLEDFASIDMIGEFD